MDFSWVVDAGSGIVGDTDFRLHRHMGTVGTVHRHGLGRFFVLACHRAMRMVCKSFTPSQRRAIVGRDCPHLGAERAPDGRTASGIPEVRTTDGGDAMSNDAWRYYDELTIEQQLQIKPLWGVATREYPHEAYRYHVRDGVLVDRKRAHLQQRWENGDWR